MFIKQFIVIFVEMRQQPIYYVSALINEINCLFFFLNDPNMGTIKFHSLNDSIEKEKQNSNNKTMAIILITYYVRNMLVKCVA